LQFDYDIVRTENELEHCPFHEPNEDCNDYQVIEVPFVINLFNTNTRYQVRCVYCGATGPCEGSKEEAIAAWNKRVNKKEVSQ